MGDGRKGIGERWSEFQPSKILWFWSCVAVAAVTIVVGFTYGGWVTGGSADEMAENAAQKAKAQIVASVCVERFVNADQFAGRLETLKKSSSWDRDDTITKGGWTKLAGMTEPVDNAADLCAQKLVEMEAPKKAATKTGNRVSQPADTVKGGKKEAG